MRLGLFMMPLHPPQRDYGQMLREDLEAVVLADEVGFDDVWIGEHFTTVTEPVTSPLIFMANAIPLTERIRFGTGVINLPQQHPAAVAGFAAMFDHLSGGRFALGIGPGGLPSDFELFGLEDAGQRAEMMRESIEMILEIWTTDPPYDIRGKYWRCRHSERYVPELGLGVLPKPLQKPHPPIAMSAMSPFSGSVREAAKRGWIALTANFIPADSAASHWKRFVEGSEEAGIAPDGERWHLARTILVTETDAEAQRYLASDSCAARFYFHYLATQMKMAGFAQIMKGLNREMPDEALTVDWAIDNIMIAGSPDTVAGRLLALRERIGPFGTIVLAGLDWDRPELWQRSMTLMAEEVMPRIHRTLGPAAAAE
jgi:alkanesulfonate monooxygenase SsuD/methylene tetrahydromethanopterin reductase-like flavin-dependent oxidoreductase (luciferase family)